MARTVTEIKAGITTDFMANESMATYYGFAMGDSFDSVFAKVSFESIIFYIVASAIFVLESLYDTLKAYVDAALAARLTHNRQWYVDLSKAFQYGDAINPLTGTYDIIDESKQVIDYAAVDEINGTLFIKVARLVNGELAPLSAEQITAFTSYIQAAKDAGVVVQTISDEGDDARLVIDIWYDAQVLNADGSAIDGSGEPAKDTVQSYLKNLPFNGEFTILALEDTLQITKGVVIPNTLSAESKYANNEWDVIDGKVKPHAGYMVVKDENLTLNYRAYDGN
ncbi:hypothetical protein [Carboxylicivirga linearis]|uniref:Nucleotidyltransferase n=1 Tax=Carboxylicivirga linearis TaxID=1628157 RepID=A0ABS5JWE8_9BACT|nr:hypothetical protein [Carboxylicivirga linearis]MBS2099198.1 hypothetical protein [Carboxylicivirga linearis]